MNGAEFQFRCPVEGTAGYLGLLLVQLGLEVHAPCARDVQQSAGRRTCPARGGPLPEQTREQADVPVDPPSFWRRVSASTSVKQSQYGAVGRGVVQPLHEGRGWLLLG
jgi:hypothetical protein